MMKPESGLGEYPLHMHPKNKWRRISTHKRAGVLVPLFSIYSKNSLGFGEFADLKLLIDWSALTGNSIIQLLPMNEVGSLFCPYDSLSSFALEPAYLSLLEIPAARNKAIEARIKNLKSSFPASGLHLNYAAKKEKIALLSQIYTLRKNDNSEELRRFQEENSYWLPDFALYKVLKDYHQGGAWYSWEDKFRNRQVQALEYFRKEHEREISFQVWLQWQLYRQFKGIKEYAKKKKVLLKGDLPILVSRDSADVWAHPEFFKLDFVAGAPPDMYCAKGQRWGMPTYNWERIAAENFSYLKERLKFAGNFYDILRIDHVVGLFRIWSIPYSQPSQDQGLHGFFDPADEKKWPEQGRRLLTVMLENTDSLLCAEDLGVIPQTCTDTLKELGIPGNDVQRWTKDYKTRHDFLAPKEYRLLSAAMLSTHDTTNWPAWWENEAGTVDEALFIRKCSDHRHINFNVVKMRLFDSSRSVHGRLRWLDDIDSVDKLVVILGKRKEELADFIEMYNNTYHEKEKLWKQLDIKGPMREECDKEILLRVLRITLKSKAVFCINTIIDWLYLADVFAGDPHQYRINTPGTISDKNWSLRIPIPLEELPKFKVTKQIRSMISASGRI